MRFLFLLVNAIAVSLHCSNYNTLARRHGLMISVSSVIHIFLYVTEIYRMWGSDVRTVENVCLETCIEISIKFS